METLNLVKADIEQRLRSTGARHLRSESLPDAFFASEHVASLKSQGVASPEEEKSRSPDARLQVQKKLAAIKAKRAEEAASRSRDQGPLSEDEEATSQVRGTVKASSGLWFNFNLVFKAASKEVTLTVKQHGKNGAFFAKQQSLAKSYIQAVTGDSSFKGGDQGKVLRELKADIEQRLRQISVQPANSLPEKFFSAKISNQAGQVDEPVDDQEVEFNEPESPEEVAM